MPEQVLSRNTALDGPAHTYTWSLYLKTLESPDAPAGALEEEYAAIIGPDKEGLFRTTSARLLTAVGVTGVSSEVVELLGGSSGLADIERKLAECEYVHEQLAYVRGLPPQQKAGLFVLAALQAEPGSELEGGVWG